MSTPTVEQRDARIRELLLLGNQVDLIVAKGPNFSRADVLRVASANGWTLDPSGRVPRTDRARAAAPAQAPRPAPTSPPSLAVVPPPADVSQPRLWTVLVEGQEHKVPAIQRRAKKLLEQLTQLAADVDAAAEAQRKRDRLAALDREREKLRAEISGKTKSASTSRGTGEEAQARAWAATNNVEVPARGRLPKTVIEQWRKSQE